MEGTFGPTDRNDQIGQNGPPSKLVPNIPIGPNRNGLFHLMYQPKFPEFWVEWKASLGSRLSLILGICDANTSVSTNASILEIRFRENLAKLTGSAVRINSKKPKGKNTMKEKKRNVERFEPTPQFPPAKVSAVSHHWAMQPLHRLSGKNKWC